MTSIMETELADPTRELDRPSKRSRRRKVQTTRVRFFGEVFTVTDDEDPDEVIERYVASGKHKLLEAADPGLAAEMTERFIARHDPGFKNPRSRRRK